MTRTRTHAGVAQCCSLAAFIVFIKGALKERWPPLVSLVGRLDPLCTAHFADCVSSASRRQRTQVEDLSEVRERESAVSPGAPAVGAIGGARRGPATRRREIGGRECDNI